jgi:hypothetical protein
MEDLGGQEETGSSDTNYVQSCSAFIITEACQVGPLGVVRS